MNWSRWRSIPWVDTRARFVASVKPGGKLLDLGSSEGGTLRHFAELRPDLSFASADIAGLPETYPPGTDFRRANFDTDRLPWPDGSFDAVTCMHVVEHLQNPQHILSEAARVLKPDGLLYVETPHPKSVSLRSAVGPGTEHVTVNFYDDPTHIRPVSVGHLVRVAKEIGLKPIRGGTSRNWLFTAAFPFLYAFRHRSRQRYVAQLHWTGWSVFLIASR